MTVGVVVWFSFAAATTLMVAYATDPNPLQDFCVATNDPNNKVYVNGHLCKDPKEVTADDFIFHGMNIGTDTNNTLGTNHTHLTPSTFPGLNTLGLSIVRLDYAASGGMVPPHFHPRATEVLTLLKGSLYTGFISGANKLYSKVLVPGDVFIYPQGLVHFAYNVADTDATSLAAFSSENPGNSRVANAIFGTDPLISVDVLSKAFQLDPKIVEDLQSTFPI